MPQFLTREDLDLCLGGSEAVEALVSGPDTAASVLQALDAAEGEARTFLGARFLLPTSPGETPEDLKALIAKAFPYHASLLFRPLSTENSKGHAAVHKLAVRDVYQAMVSGAAVIEGLVSKSATKSGGTVGIIARKPPPEKRPVDSGAFDDVRAFVTGDL